MSRIRMKVFIRNESDASLNLSGSEVSSGEFTPGWNPPAVISPGEKKGFQGEGDAVLDVPTTGTEGRVRYNVVAPDHSGELYIHWNSPLVESPYGNTFHIWAPAGWEVTQWGGQGHHAELEIRFRRTARRSVPKFNPTGRGFAFSNASGNWSSELPVISVGYIWNKLFESLPGPLGELGISLVDEDWLPLTDASMGLCGGMVYAVMDYYNHHLLPPSQNTNPTSSEDELFKYIRDRLWDSFDVTGQGHRFLGYSSPHYPNGDEGVLQQVTGLARGRSWVTYREEFPRIQDDIDAGRLSPVGLIQTDSLDVGENHQVLAYAYQRDGQEVTLYIHDPNIPRQEVALRFNVTQTDGEVSIARSPSGKRIWCLFRINGYAPKMPPLGRHFGRSVREAVLATTTQPAPPYSVRTAMAGSNTGSVKTWMQQL